MISIISLHAAGMEDFLGLGIGGGTCEKICLARKNSQGNKARYEQT